MAAEGITVLLANWPDPRALDPEAAAANVDDIVDAVQVEWLAAERDGAEKAQPALGIGSCRSSDTKRIPTVRGKIQTCPHRLCFWVVGQV